MGYPSSKRYVLLGRAQQEFLTGSSLTAIFGWKKSSVYRRHREGTSRRRAVGGLRWPKLSVARTSDRTAEKTTGQGITWKAPWKGNYVKLEKVSGCSPQ